MSSNLRIVKVCEYCKQEFVARKTTTQTCSDPRAKRLYKVRVREKAISRVKLETEVKRKPEAFVTEEQVRVIQAKEWLTHAPVPHGVRSFSIQLLYFSLSIALDFQQLNCLAFF